MPILLHVTNLFQSTLRAVELLRGDSVVRSATTISELGPPGADQPLTRFRLFFEIGPRAVAISPRVDQGDMRIRGPYLPIQGVLNFNIEYSGERLGFHIQDLDQSKLSRSHSEDTSWFWVDPKDHVGIDLSTHDPRYHSQGWEIGFFHRHPHNVPLRRCKVSCGQGPPKEDCIDCKVGRIISRTCC